MRQNDTFCKTVISGKHQNDTFLPVPKNPVISNSGPRDTWIYKPVKTVSGTENTAIFSKKRQNPCLRVRRIALFNKTGPGPWLHWNWRKVQQKGRQNRHGTGPKLPKTVNNHGLTINSSGFLLRGLSPFSTKSGYFTEFSDKSGFSPEMLTESRG